MGVEGKITSAQTGAPISDVRVRLYYRSCSSGYYFEASCTTFFAASTVSDATGWYKVAGHAGHSYNLAAFHPQFLSWDERIGEGNQTQDIVLEARTP